jgi:hypothetical protein
LSSALKTPDWPAKCLQFLEFVMASSCVEASILYRLTCKNEIDSTLGIQLEIYENRKQKETNTQQHRSAMSAHLLKLTCQRRKVWISGKLRHLAQ